MPNSDSMAKILEGNTEMPNRSIILRIIVLSANLTIFATFGNAETESITSQSSADANSIIELRRKADQGDRVSQITLGWYYENGQIVGQNYKKAVTWYRKAAEQGDVGTQYHLGCMYYYGQGVEQDLKQAKEWIRKAADHFVLAQYFLGTMYFSGQGTEQDYKQAIIWYRKAADQGYTVAQNNLGVMYLHGQGVEQDIKQAVQWFRKAADQGYAEAQFNLGLMYFKGEGVEKDNKQAVEWYRRSAEQGFSTAQFNLGLFYAAGIGAIEDYIEAYKWYLLAGINGQDVNKAKEILQQKMTAAQTAEAQRLAKEFVPKIEGAAPSEENRPKDLKYTGTGFFIDAKGTILTANHVIEKAKTIRIMAGEKILEAKVVAADAGLDIAILKVEGQGFEWLPIAASAGVKAGEENNLKSQI